MSETTNISIDTASVSDIEFCWKLEGELGPHRPGAEAEGFLLRAIREEYELCQQSGILLIARNGDLPVGFVMALPPGHPRLKRLTTLVERFSLSNPKLLELPDLAWIAKVAVSPASGRSGVGMALYRRLFAELKGNPVMTATLIRPLNNYASSAFHQRMGFLRVGTFHSGDRDGLVDCVSDVVFKASESSTPGSFN